VDPHRRPGLDDELRRRWRRWVEPADQWRTKVQRWVDAGTVSSTPGEEVVASESNESAAMTNANRVDPNRSSLSFAAESTSYIGLVVVALGTTSYLGHYWDGLGVAGQVCVTLLVTVAGLFGGLVVAQIGDAGSRRVSGVLRLLGTGGAAMTTAVALGPATVDDRGLTLLCVGVVVTGLSAALWRNRDRSLQFLSTLLGVALTFGAVSTLAHLHATSSEVALLVWFFAVGTGLMSLQMIRPAPTALVAGELGSFVGAFAFSFPHHLVGVLLGIVSALGAVGIGLALERPPVVVIGAIGFFMFDFRIFALYLRSTNVALGAFVLGVVLVVAALWRATALERRKAASPDDWHVDAEGAANLGEPIDLVS
jgi:hypothetical protein